MILFKLIEKGANSKIIWDQRKNEDIYIVKKYERINIENNNTSSILINE